MSEEGDNFPEVTLDDVGDTIVAETTQSDVTGRDTTRREEAGVVGDEGLEPSPPSLSSRGPTEGESFEATGLEAGCGSPSRETERGCSNASSNADLGSEGQAALKALLELPAERRAAVLQAVSLMLGS